jgi:hypothetical protein
VRASWLSQEYSSKVQQRGHSSAIRSVSWCLSPLLNALWRQPCSWFGTKRPQVQILSPRPASPQVRGPRHNWRGPHLPEVQQQNTASTATKTRIDLRIERGSPSLRCASRVAIGTSVRIDLQRHRHVRLTPDPHEHPRVDFQVNRQRRARPPRVVHHQVADTGLAASSSKTPVGGPRIDRRPVVTGEHQVDSSLGRSRLPIAGGGQGGDDVAQRRYTR